MTWLLDLLDSLELSWFEKDTGASFINLSCLPALVNSSCLHKLSRLSDLSSRRSSMHVWVDYDIGFLFMNTLFASVMISVIKNARLFLV